MEQLILSIESLDINNASACSAAWLAAMQQTHSEVLIDAEGLTNIDSAGLQMLLSLQKEVLLSRKKFSIRGSSESIRQKAAAIGLAQLLSWEA